MWPGQQEPGGPQYPQQPPQNQPPWGHQQQPSPYQPQQHPAYQQPPQMWGPPPGPGGPPKPPGGGRGAVIAVSVVAAVAVIAAGVLVAVKLTEDDRDPQAGPSTGGSPAASSSAPESPSPTPTATTSEEGPGPDDARGNPGEDTIKPVVPGWQTVVRSDMGVAYDLPKAWTVKPEGLLIGYEWDKNRVVTGGAAVLDEKWCGTDERGLAGVKGGKGAKSLKTQAVNEAYNWAYGKYNREGATKLTEAAPRAYTNAQGVHGWIASTRATGMKGKCAADGTSYSFTFLGKDKEVRSWLLIVDSGYAGATDAGTVAKVRDSVRLVG
ncbi:hypothetical protein [Actinacidiphila glaucinigra]|uniref:DUF8017 domain-containing protein n=1 Tax=Actinacidiphila glaucinigra TaxID=235986 RepID=A0A239FZ90_9ACTN|nr:hypothetical protein [Actinacidiphila glaucinigra]SNS62357.1 hypothetical protein SAMN05216252_107156 [Actinacidiphila glaucinigra]